MPSAGVNAPVWVVVTAAGSGNRLGAKQPKALVSLAGRTLLEHALQRVSLVQNLAGVVVTIPAVSLPDFAPTKPACSIPVFFVEGGASRQASVFAGLQAVAQYAPLDALVLVHDAARCLMPTEVFDRVASRVAETGHATIAALPVVDTIKQVSQQNPQQVAGTVDRNQLRIVQTPQGFVLDQILQLHEQAQSQGDSESTAATDDAGLAETAGQPVEIVDGASEGFKITTPTDLKYAQFLVNTK
ncbi:2-C-methyl-D-erythritol 4-phosphate cytidylyltransferase [Boudabousia marimammalium]|uniref:2-C-methyl-D-erythritol 4-phosphate cytidylyltransferase n=1 Tax=Boudabousia marimammalium TaxID=156892 RepID=A0A1Q5PM89_9ACTO|nr:2-C-methyl-D-erythritol 4-phosphate cytidylyltransferase [Boudabousia marimammalium]OKL48639.1 2-C-methyl-D-erythritol 4-phosphate cytidylyltransferase [Boudabousia marimammalium]